MLHELISRGKKWLTAFCLQCQSSLRNDLVQVTFWPHLKGLQQETVQYSACLKRVWIIRHGQQIGKSQQEPFFADFARPFPLCPLSFAHSVNPSSCHVAAMPVVESHGQLEPRDRGDVRRAAERAALLLSDGRPVQPKTRDNREALLLKFDIWLKASGDSVAGLIDVQDPDVDRVNTLLELYGRDLFSRVQLLYISKVRPPGPFQLFQLCDVFGCGLPHLLRLAGDDAADVCVSQGRLRRVR